MSALSISHAASPRTKVKPLDRDLRGYLRTNADIVTRITKPVKMEHIGALSAQSDRPILFENIVEKPGFRLCDILVKNRELQARALGVPREDYLPTLAHRLRKPPRGFARVKDGPVKEVKCLGKDADWTMVPAETLDLDVPAHAEIVVEGTVDLESSEEVGVSVSPSSYYLPKSSRLPAIEITAITMRGDRPIYRNHQSCPETDHQPLPRLCHEAVLYNRLTEMGLKVKDVRFPTWGAALSCIVQFEYPRAGFVNDALMQVMGAPWLNTKMAIAVSPDTDVDKPSEVYHAIATRCDPARDIIIVPGTRGSPYDPSAAPIPGDPFWRTVGKIGIDATAKARHDPKDFERSWPKNWGKVKLEDYL